MKINRNIQNCEFPSWVLKQWKIIPRGGMRALPQNSVPSPRQVTFNDKSSFILSMKLVNKNYVHRSVRFIPKKFNVLQGSTRGQQFKCADVVNSSNTEIIFKTFTQSQCYGEYHCFHAKLTNDNLVEIHVGAPTPNVEHACLKPSFDLEVPYLLATLIPTDMGIYKP